MSDAKLKVILLSQESERHMHWLLIPVGQTLTVAAFHRYSTGGALYIEVASCS